MKSKNICVIGAGSWGKNHINTLHSLGCLAGVVDIDENKTKFFRKKYKYLQVFENVEQTIGKFDGYVIATSAKTHFAIAKYLIEENQPILIEKPITLNSKDALLLHEMATRKKVNIMVGHVLLFHPAFVKIKELIDSGKLGKIQYLYSNRLNLGKIRTEENVFWSFAPHDIALFQFFTKSFPREITSRGIDALQDGIHDTTITSLAYPNNIMGHIFVSWLHPFKEHRFVVVGSKGMIRFEDSAENKPLVFYDKNVSWENGLPIAHSGDTVNVEYGADMPLTNELKYFIGHLNSERVNINNSEQALDVIKILESATQSLLGKN